jgi:hypothetical protein
MERFESLGKDIFRENVFTSNKIIINLDTKYDEMVQIPGNIQRGAPIAAAAAASGSASAEASAEAADRKDYRQGMPLPPNFDLELELKLKYLILKDIK